MEPFPFLISPIYVTSPHRSRSAVCQVRRHGKEQFNGHGVLVILGLGPPDSTAARIIPTRGHIGKDRFSHRKILSVSSEIISIDPSQSPPAFIVVELVQ